MPSKRRYWCMWHGEGNHTSFICPDYDERYEARERSKGLGCPRCTACMAEARFPDELCAACHEIRVSIEGEAPSTLIAPHPNCNGRCQRAEKLESFSALREALRAWKDAYENHMIAYGEYLARAGRETDRARQRYLYKMAVRHLRAQDDARLRGFAVMPFVEGAGREFADAITGRTRNA